MAALLLLACLAPVETAAPEAAYVPPDRPDAIVYVWAGTTAEVDAGSGYAIALAEPEALVAQVGDRLCSVTGDGRILDADGDGVCELSPPVDLAISVWR